MYRKTSAIANLRRIGDRVTDIAETEESDTKTVRYGAAVGREGQSYGTCPCGFLRYNLLGRWASPEVI